MKLKADGKGADMMVSVVVPAFNEQETVSSCVSAVREVLDTASIPFTILFVDDGSKDNTWSAIQKESEQDCRVCGIRFSRNFGKEAALFAGLEFAEGDCVVMMDCDLQHPPEKIVEMVHLWKQGYEVVEGVKSDRGEESSAHRTAAKVFYKWISKAVGQDMSNASDFKLLDRKVVDVLKQMPERNVFFRALSFWVGFKRAEVSYEVRERVAGRSKWGIRSLIRYAISNLISFSSAPLTIITAFGILMLVVSAVLGIIAIVQKIAGVAVEGFTTVILIQLFSGSILMISLGIIGTYISRIYAEIKARPRYIVSESCRNSYRNGSEQ